jgi:hypothetical protein
MESLSDRGPLDFALTRLTSRNFRNQISHSAKNVWRIKLTSFGVETNSCILFVCKRTGKQLILTQTRQRLKLVVTHIYKQNLLPSRCSSLSSASGTRLLSDNSISLKIMVEAYFIASVQSYICSYLSLHVHIVYRLLPTCHLLCGIGS